MRLKREKGKEGFTLIEILVVVMILGILATVILPRIMSKPDEARVTKARMDIKALEGALSMYKLDNGFYPDTDQGLAALVTIPTTGRIPKKYSPDGYLKKIPRDPWDNPYVYISPGSQGDFDIVCLGADGEMGGEGFNADIQSWDMD
ncbi:MAG: type II secretion system major pseudopilin GspG [Nitrospinota bacterium]|nr:type II secretion system major pseudopilin GspG [Nitrospinota bacterium]MDH5678266.1 type II secretion system major pseudopilin GspG [Nitrospinota bacterium]MDH5755482.1 type II secretion system major pseudopilin GspG [Nitrospinota bacterium]